MAERGHRKAELVQFLSLCKGNYKVSTWQIFRNLFYCNQCFRPIAGDGTHR